MNKNMLPEPEMTVVLCDNEMKLRKTDCERLGKTIITGGAKPWN
jgi:hypothetical protein